MAVEATKVLRDLRKGMYHPVYFLQGTESFYIDKISNYIEESALEESQKGFNQVVSYGKDIDMSAVLGNAKRFPMMSDRQVVIIKEAQDLKDLNNEGGQKMLLNYLENPLESTVLVFCYKNKELDKRKKFVKELEKKTVFVHSKKLYDNQVPAWTSQYLNDYNSKITYKASAMLIEAVGTNLSKISNELDKILLNFKNQSLEITANHIEEYVGVSKDFNIFELQKALVYKDVLRANKITLHFSKNPKEYPLIPTLALLYGFFTKLLLVHHSKDRSEKGIAMLLKVNSFFVKDYREGIKNYPLVKVMEVIRLFREADGKSKGINAGGISEGDILKELVFKILH
ncbi:MAG: DNA polymerase III subunit delta [Cytophagales bacterium]|nr:DNA polymerase III subunit delta [Cytophagales bacterium]